MPEDKRQIAFTGTEEYRFWLQEEARKRRVKVQKLLEDAVELYISGQTEQTLARATDAFTTAHGEREQRLVPALLLFLRDKSASELHPVVEVLLRPWIDKAAKKRAATSQRNTA